MGMSRVMNRERPPLLTSEACARSLLGWPSNKSEMVIGMVTAWRPHRRADRPCDIYGSRPKLDGVRELGKIRSSITFGRPESTVTRLGADCHVSARVIPALQSHLALASGTHFQISQSS